MTNFEDGPAKGQKLMLHRAAIFLRVTEANGKFDALDHPDDTPHASEKLYAYALTERPGSMHINRGRGGGGFYPVATYKLVEIQPDDSTMRISSKWASWCNSQPHHLRAAGDEGASQ